MVAKLRWLRRCPARVVRIEERYRYEIKVSELSNMMCKTE